jgi:hypothetical protein
MASVTFDGQSLTVDSRRIWLVSGTLYYARIPRELWRDRIRSARLAGLNCICVPVFWNVHEPQRGVFRFDGEADLHAFIRLIADEGMSVILRPGPFVGSGWDMGGLPAWLLDGQPIKLREADPLFMQAVAHYFEQVMEHVRDLLVTADKPGPIVMAQVEHEWLCGNDEQAEDYLGQLVRFLRESGCNVPFVSANNLWQQVSGTIDGWIGREHLLTNCRQLRVIRPDAPALVTSLFTGGIETWTGPTHRVSSDELVRSIIDASAAGAMVNLEPICGGTNFGFRGGRLLGGDDRFVATSFDGDAPISETGERTAKFTAIKRVCTFLSQFHDVFSHIHPHVHHAAAETGLSVVQQSGAHGNVVFITRDGDVDTQQIEIATPHGQSLPVFFGNDRVAWLLLSARLGGVATLDLTNLRPWAFLNRKMLVLFGPAGTPGLISLDSTLHSITVPTGSEPLVFKHDAITVVVLNEQQVDAAVIEGGQLRLEGKGGAAVFEHSGEAKRVKSEVRPKLTPPKLGKWDVASLAAYATGKAPRFATLDGPKSLEACGVDYGYGWYRLRLKRKKAGKVNLMIPRAADRLHLYTDGKLRGILGVGHGATLEPLTVNLAAGDNDVVFLADNLGRFAEGLALDRPSGIFGPVLDVKELKLGKPAITSEPRADVFALRGFVPGASTDDRGPYPRVTWTVNLASKEPLVLTLTGPRPRSVVLLNGTPIGFDLDHAMTTTLLLDGVKKGANRITLAHIETSDGKPIDATLHQATEVLSTTGSWWYARWQMPDASAFGSDRTADAPAFFRATFPLESTARPLLAEITGGTKGQIYLNGHNIGRYVGAGRKTKSPRSYYLPEPWLKVGENELIVFDEHGKSPAVKLVV